MRECGEGRVGKPSRPQHEVPALASLHMVPGPYPDSSEPSLDTSYGALTLASAQPLLPPPSFAKRAAP